MQASLIRATSFFAMLQMFSLLLAVNAFGHDPATDTSIIMSRFEEGGVRQSQSISFIEPKNERLVARYNPISLAFGGMMFVYQRFMSPQLPSECLYHPSCSSFSKSLVSEYGLVLGIAATADRLFRCNRVAVFDIHPMHLDEQSGKVHEDPGIYRRNKE